MTEHDIQNEIRVRLSRYGLVFRINTGTGRTPDGRYFCTGVPPGFPDLICIANGKVLFIEVKKPGGRISEAQHRMHDAITANGGIVAVVYSADEAEERLKNI